MQFFPEPFLQIIEKQIGDELPEFIAALSQIPPSSIRYNPFKYKPDGIEELDKIPWSTYGYYQNVRPKYTLDPLLHAGAYYVQEASSMYLGYLLRSLMLPDDAVILDLCAAPGGKSIDILSNISQNAFLVSNEVIGSRAQVLRENITKYGSSQVLITNCDPSSFSSMGSIFDVIVVDAPCSGEGMFRKDHNSINEWSEANVDLCHQRQQRILTDVWPCLKPGGILIYSTCTYNKLEDEDKIKWLVDKFDATKVPLPNDNSWGTVKTEMGLKFYPHKVKGEGFFISCVKKPGELTSEGFNTKKSKFEKLRKEDFHIKHWVDQEQEYDWVKFNNVIKILPKGREQLVSFLANYAKIVKAGVDVCEVKGKDYIPCQDLATFSKTNQSEIETCDLNLENALHYLRKEDFSLEATPGIVLLTYQNLGLGFAKKIENRFNNYYPNEWRIRMK